MQTPSKNTPKPRKPRKNKAATPDRREMIKKSALKNLKNKKKG